MKSEAKKADIKLDDFIIDVTAALSRLENNLIHLNKTSIQKVEKKILIDDQYEDVENSQSLS